MRSRGRPTVAGVSISNPDRLLWPELGITKLEFVEFQESIAEWILPHLRDRPLTLVHCPKGLSGECTFMKHSKLWAPAQVRRVQIAEKTKVGDYLIVDDLPALIGVAQMDVLELHTWNSKFERVEEADRIVFDLDAGPKVKWTQVIEAAIQIRRVLEALGLRSFVKNTGGSGLHVVVPLKPAVDWAECLRFSRLIAALFVRQDPKLYTTDYAKAGRKQKILIDYLRNNRTNTSVCAYSTRAKPHAPVSVPLSWDELSEDVMADHFTVRNVHKRLSRGRDPWREYSRTRQTLKPEMIAAVERTIAG
ncbi:MAG: non-homologous end-joining DNA ligase [Myxococcaceae bacterium]